MLVESRSSGARCFSCPRCSVISSFSAVSKTDLVNCLSSPSGPVRDRPCSRACRTSSLAAVSSAEGSGFFFGTTSSVVIRAPSPLTSSARQAGNTVAGTAPAAQDRQLCGDGRSLVLTPAKPIGVAGAGWAQLLITVGRFGSGPAELYGTQGGLAQSAVR